MSMDTQGRDSRPSFCVNPLDRSDVERDTAALDRVRDDPETLTIVLAGDDVVLTPQQESATALTRLGSPLGQAAARAGIEQALLGFLDGRPVVATLVEAETFAADAGLQTLDLRSIAVQGIVPEAELGMLAQAKALFHWHRTHGFCARCGAATHPAPSRLRRDCPACAAQHFPRTDPVVIMLVTRGENCLLGRQSRFVPGMYSCLAGFVSQGETIEASVRREVMEEAGIQVGRVRYLTSQPWPFPSSLMIGCQAEAESEAITLDREELEDGRWFSRDEVRAMLERRHPDGLSAPHPIAIAHHLLRGWICGRTETG
jgi:NAD+ diphosphatase